MDQPQESDDPNATIAVILDGIRALGYKPDFPPIKLKTGCGEQCIWVLDCLCDCILKLQQFAFKTPEYPAEEEEKAEIVEECENVASDCDDVSHLARDDYDDDSDVVGLDELRQLGLQLDAGAGDANDVVTREMLQSNVVDSEWKLEVERILPQLKTAVETESKEQDWRYHVHQMHKYSDAIESCMKDTGSQLERLSNDINKTLEKIAGRERCLNDELYCRLNWLRSAHDRRAEKKNTYRQVSVRLADMSKYLAELGEELNRVRQEIEDRGNSMADGAPLVKIKQAITRTRQETMEMDIRVGLLQHIVLRQTLNARLQLRDTAVANSAAAFLD